MGTRPAKPFGEPICNKIELIKKTLEDAGYHVRYYTGTSGKREGERERHRSRRDCESDATLLRHLHSSSYNPILP